MAATVDPRNIAAFSAAPEEEVPEDTDLVLIDRAGTIKYATLAGVVAVAAAPDVPDFGISQETFTADGVSTGFELSTEVLTEDLLLVFDNGVFTREFTISQASSLTTVNFDYTPNSGNTIAVAILSIAATEAGSGAVSSATAAEIADAGDPINTDNKVRGRIVWDTTNEQFVIATGSGATDDWLPIVTDTPVTPS